MKMRVFGKSSIASLALVATMAYASDGQPARHANQSWDAQEIAAWSFASQGSRLLPVSWFRALERPDRTGQFASLKYLESFGYLSSTVDSEFPIGFAVDAQADSALVNTRVQWYGGQPANEPWLGFTCAACHTGEINTSGGPVQIFGAPGMGDFQSFVSELNRALKFTADEDERFAKFAQIVLDGKDSASNRVQLRKGLRKVVVYQEKVARPNNTTSHYGFARVDAFGYIFNKTLQLSNSVEVNGNSSTAPVSYPFLWDIWRQDKVQWNGAVAKQLVSLPGGGKLDVGALGRNSGEVVGVFGEVVVTPPALLGAPNYKSSIQIKNLSRIENLLMKLKPPTWRDVFGSDPYDKTSATDLAAFQHGKALFGEHCASCHLPRETWVEDKPIERIVSLKKMRDNGNLTDIRMACNAFNYTGPTGMLRGTRVSAIGTARHGISASVAAMLNTVVIGSLIGDADHVISAGIDNIFRPGRLPIIHHPGPNILGGQGVLTGSLDAACINAVDNDGNPVNGYKARPLDGIWATAPFLHNGSVPTLYHLLLPAKDRPESFWVGSREYDTRFGGYNWKEAGTSRKFEFRTRDQSGNPISGNSNAGHEYGASQLTEADRNALVLYLKTL